ncbi:Acriflavine resistance protein B [gamma proteobacterium HdN1]|nr:Acriflavine resistance protein B [gamma proteobacterium HdN1]
MARFFIDRPIFAWVLAILTMLAGALSLLELPVQQYPDIAPPQVRISANYPGASAKNIEDSVTQIIEQNMTGLDGLLYMSSQSTSSGNINISLTFAPGTNPDIAQVQVQNKLSLAEPLLPTEVQQMGIMVTKASSSFFMIVGLVSTDGSMTRNDLSDYANSYVKEPLSRTPGVGELRVFGAQYAMRIWLQADKLNAYGLTPLDVKAALGEQNSQFAAGQLGALPVVKHQQLNATVIAQTRLESVEEFKNILLKVNPDGSQVRVKDVARVELGGENYNAESFYNGKPATGIAIQLSTGANALDTAKAIRAQIEQLQKFFPHGVEAVYPFDTTPFVQISISEVLKTLVEAIVLVFLVMFLFLGNFRATLIPTIAIPVVLLGTIGVMAAAGFSINTLTMFGMVLAIGLLVDDAIVVVENVERIMDEEGLSPKEAARKSMDQITSALVGIGLVLSAVFVPMAFLGGSTGVIYRQFSITIVTAMGLSVLVAIVLTPALCATLLKASDVGNASQRRGFFGVFNRWFTRVTHGYVGSVNFSIHRPLRMMVIYAVLVGGLAVLYLRMPTSFLPVEDQGVVLNLVQLPQGATISRTVKVLQQVREHYEKEPSVMSIFQVAGFSFAGQGQNMGLAFVRLKDWSERKDPSQSANAILARAKKAFAKIKDGKVNPINLPPIPQLGTASGFDMILQDRNSLGHDRLMEIRNQLVELADHDARLQNVRANGMEDVPIFRIDIDYEKVKTLGLSIASVNQTLGTAWGGSYVNDFIDRNRVKKVYLQADAPFRMVPEDIDKWYVRNDKNQMVPFSAFTTTRWDYGSPRLERFNGIPSVNIQGEAAEGQSSGEAMAVMEALVQQMPDGVGLEWTGMSYQERVAGSQTPFLLAISLLTVFLCLAALYESWSVPFSVMLVVPLGVFGALLMALSRGLSNDVYFQVGLLTTIGLSAKNAILIVEFAKEQVDQGKELFSAAIDAARLRLRPIIMTSMAFVLGVFPLAISSGAGAMSRQAIGSAVIGGVLAATFLAIFFVPLFYVLVMKLSFWMRGVKPAQAHPVERL